MAGLYSPAILAGWARRYALTAATLAIVLCIAADATACPNCKEGLAQSDPHGQSIAAGYYYSILFMMSMPFIILTTFGSFAYRSVRNARREHGSAGRAVGSRQSAVGQMTDEGSASTIAES